ncbi:MAG: hypothetical protein JW882_17170 [Deltaproteobacteria bacterium]|nr:hypothetical protein [Deltaproteobacteria bacterium]
MRIEEYFLKVKGIVESTSIVYLSNITYEKRGTYEGFISGRLQFIDDTVLEWREFIDVEIIEDRLMYTYHYMTSSNEIIFRYDNTGHNKKLGLPTYPHHKHDGSEEKVLPAKAADIDMILQEISLMVIIPT